MGKNPAFQFYPNDWARDLEEHTLEIEGAWIRICCKLWWSDTRGKLTKTVLQWSRILRVSVEDTIRILTYIKNESIGKISCDFHECNDFVTVISRRMERDEKERESNRLRVKKFREKQECNAPVTAMSQRSSSSSSSSVMKYSDSFLEFYNAYPLKKSKTAAYKSWTKLKPDLDTCLFAIKNQTTEKRELRKAGKFCPEWKHPSTWLNQGCWEDEINTEPKVTHEYLGMPG